MTIAIGSRNHALEVIGPSKRIGDTKRYRTPVRCDCGTEKWVRWHPSTKTCGCGRGLYKGKQVGYQHGHLTVLGPARTIQKEGHKATHYPVRCVCGTEKIVALSSSTVSCGCKNLTRVRTTKFEAQVGHLNDRYSMSKSQAKRRELDHTLTREEFKNLSLSNCHYCDLPPSNKHVRKGRGKLRGETTTLLYSGIDRKDCNKGYTPENSVSCCRTCNVVKGTLSKEEFEAWIVRLCKRYNIGN